MPSSPTWKNFCAGLLAAVAAGGLISVVDMFRVGRGLWDTATSWQWLTGLLTTGAFILAASLLLGLWVGAAVAGLGNGQPLRALVDSVVSLFRILDRTAETERVATVLALLGCLVGWLGGALPLFRAATTRIVQPHLAALFTCLLLLGWALVVGTLFPLLRRGARAVLAARTRVWSRQLGLCSLPAIMAGMASCALTAAWVAREPLSRFLYALELTPFLYAGAALGLVPTCLALLATRAGDRWVVLACRPGVLPAAAALLLGASWVAADTVADDSNVREQLFEGSPAGAAIFLVLKPDAPSVSLALGDDEESGEGKPETLDREVQAEPPPPTPLGKTPDVLVLTVETLRADRVGVFGYTRHPTTPNLDAFATGAARFERAYVSGPCTSASFIGLFSSQLPSRIAGITRDGDVFSLPPGLVTLAQQFRAGGFHTRALLPIVPNYLRGAERGFNQFDRSFHYAESQATRTITALQERPRDRPLFLWVHFVDPHHPYEPHAPFKAFGDAPEDRYDQEIAFVDMHLARIFQHLADTGALEHTVVAVFGDHGEAFGEHGTRLHGNSLHDEEIRVAFVMRGPGIQAQTITSPVSLLDLGPTLLELGGLGWTGGSRTGISLASTLRQAAAPPPRTVLAEGCKPGTMLALIDQRKLFYRKRGSRYFLYDLASDPRERTNTFAAAGDAADLVTRVQREMARGQ